MARSNGEQLSKRKTAWKSEDLEYPFPEPAAFAPSKTALVLSPFRLLLSFVPIESKAKQK